MRRFYVYKIVCNINSKIYIGKGTWDKGEYIPKQDNYYGSGLLIKRAILLHGKDYFTKEILSWWEKEEDAYIEEIKMIELYQSCSSDIGYNLTVGGNGFNSESGKLAFKMFLDKGPKKVEEITRERVKKLKAGYEVPGKREKHGEKVKEAWSKIPKERREARNLFLKNYCNREDIRILKKEIMEEFLRDESRASAYKEKLSISHKKSYESQELRDKISKAVKKRFSDPKVKEEHIKMLNSELMIEKNKKYNGPITCLRREYRRGKVSEEDFLLRENALLEWKKDWDLRYQEYKDTIKNEDNK